MSIPRSLALTLTASLFLSSSLLAQGPRWFHPLSNFGVPDGGIAEIVGASGDGKTLVYSDAGNGRVGFVDLSDAKNPRSIGTIQTKGEPTSVAVLGNIAVAAVWLDKKEEGKAPPRFDPSELLVIDIADPKNPKVLGSVPIGHHPDATKLTRIGGRLICVVCIENEPVVVKNGLVEDEDAPGFPNDVSPAGYVQVVEIDTNNPARSKVADVKLPEARMSAARLFYPKDPQPEFVDIHGTTAAVTLQENNGVAVIDIANPAAPRLKKLFSTGAASKRLTDLTEDDDIVLNEVYPSPTKVPEDGGGNKLPSGLKMADALAFSPDGRWILTADEGELDFTGGRGISAFDARTGQLKWDDGGELEQAAVIFGQMPEGRNENKGIEMEGATAARFGRHQYGFFLSERGSWMAIYNLDGRRPRLHQILPTGISPEGVVAIPGRNLLVCSEEGSGTLSIFEARRRPYIPSRKQPTPFTFSTRRPFAAMSGLGGGFGGWLFSVPDNALPTSIYAVRTGGPYAPVQTLCDVKKDGKQARYDGEGIQLDTSILRTWWRPGFWIASEGNGSSNPNLLVQISVSGRVLREIQLPFAIDAAADPKLGGSATASATGAKIRSNGFEGVAISKNGRYLYAAIQRDFASEFSGDKYTRIARYDLRQLIKPKAGIRDGLRYGGDWDFFFYQFDSDDSDNWAGLSDIVSIGKKQLMVIERDKGIGLGSELKKIYAFSLAGLKPDTDGKPDASDTVKKVEYLDVVKDFFPYEKIEGLAIDGFGNVWVGLDNDGGEVENRMRNYGRFRNPLN